MKKIAIATAVVVASAAVLVGCSSTGDESSEPKELDTGSWAVDALVTECSNPEVDPAGCSGPSETGEYVSLSRDEVNSAWNLCSVLPHLKDSTWVGVNYGQAIQAERLDVTLSIVDAGGYENLAEQVSQVEDCISSGVDAILISAVSFDSLNQVLQQAMDAGIKVIDVGNGVSLPDVDGRVLQDYIDMGQIIGDHLVELDESMRVALLPGPAGAGWSERSRIGFEQAVEGSDIDVIDVKYGDTGKEVQLGLIEDVLAANPDLDALVGNAVMLEAATAVLAEQGKTEDVRLYGTYVTPELVDIMAAGRANCGPSEQSSLIGQMSVDLAVRVLQEDYLGAPNLRFAPVPLVICGSAEGSFDNIETFDASGSFAPDGYQPRSFIESTR